jgi:hypothetical protein
MRAADLTTDQKRQLLDAIEAQIGSSKLNELRERMDDDALLDGALGAANHSQSSASASSSKASPAIGCFVFVWLLVSVGIGFGESPAAGALTFLGPGVAMGALALVSVAAEHGGGCGGTAVGAVLLFIALCIAAAIPETMHSAFGTATLMALVIAGPVYRMTEWVVERVVPS